MARLRGPRVAPRQAARNVSHRAIVARMARRSTGRRSALYRIEAYGLLNEWNLWGLANGDLTDLCRGCDGRGFTVGRPCRCAVDMEPERRARMRGWLCAEQCTREDGCPHCRRRCAVCYGRGMAAEPVHREDFGDEESLSIAQRLFHVDDRDPREFYRRRIDMHAELL